ncbi:DUF1430 domain-containing protein [Bacillus sp. Hm123]|uniref:DUF1430 domain-containing protein n=1 Tax=Bacillus sp. Hm123 TaxID=3450745 RepID=UPI003F431130
MKKIIMFLIFIQLILLSVLLFTEYDSYKTNQLLYEDTTSVLVGFEKEKRETKTFLNYLQKIAKKYEVTISKYVFQEENDLIIFTTDTKLNNDVDLKSGDYPQLQSNEFISTLNTEYENQVGTMKRVKNEFNITIKNLNQVKTFGEDGVYYIKTQNDMKLQQILSDLNKDAATVSILEKYNIPISMNNSTLLISVGIVALCIVVAFIYYLIDSLKAMSILRINGFSLQKTVLYVIKDILKPILLATILAYIVCAMYYGIVYRMDYFIELSFLFFLCFLALLFFYLLVITLSLFVISKNLKTTSSIKGRKPYFFITIINYCLKLIFIFFLLLSAYKLMVNTAELEKKSANLEIWEKTQNLYATRVTYSNAMKDLKSEYYNNIKLKRFYEELEQRHHGFLIDADNYSTMDGQFVYDLNTKGEDPSLSPQGKSITINMNYLKYNKIKTIDRSVEEQLIDNNHTRNLLVPHRLKPFKDEIIKNYKSHFYFEKVEVANIYNEEVKKEKDATKEDELSVNIIYVEDNQHYFTFNEDGGEAGYFITDPIAIIETGNVAEAAYLHYLSNSFYFYSESDDPFTELMPSIMKNKVESSIQQVESIYDLHAREIKSLKDKKLMNRVIILILIMSNVIVTFNIIASHYQKNKMKLYIKKLFGHSLIRRNWIMFFLLVTINLFPTLFMFVMFGGDLLLIGLFIILFELFVAIVIENKIARHTFNSIIKGEH